MHPAFSVIFFTTASGAGYGMLVWLGLLLPLHRLPATPWFGVPALLIALGLATAGLLSSTFHLGHPERAWRAFSQWRTSWLSREGVAAVVTYVPAGLLGLVWLFGDPNGVAGAVLGPLAAACALATVYCTAMIYASLKPVRQWHNAFVAPLYLLFALYSGAGLVAALVAPFSASLALAPALAAMAFGAVAAATKFAYWRHIDADHGGPTTADATGLASYGTVRPLEAPHTEENYLLKEMGFRIGRKHAAKLRVIAVALAFAAPIALFALAAVAGGGLRLAALAPAALIVPAGLLFERWLFFAEAKHSVMLYYGSTVR
ncbi:MAG: dimethyl sulfoxide reductase anchor subunit [Hyphomicrobiales bacterium]|nr:dimethyl sulfoxide reductase anchor subunit [Hyphomicrobiales bacterium]MDE2018525.1 dimethyl sulfoxide reductase anchor subunit [Hyphomicrobiales bacterium]